MGIIAGPSIVDDESLIFHYDMGNTVRSFKGKPTTNLNSQSAYTVEEIGGYPLLRADRVIDPESPSGYALEQQITDLGINSASRAQMGNATNIPTSGNGYVSVYAKQIAGGGWIVPRVYTGNNWYTLEPLDGGTGYLTSEYRRFGRDVTFDINSGGPLPAFSMTHLTSEKTLDKITRWHSPQVETGTFITPYVNGTRSDTQAIIDLTGSVTATAEADLVYNADNTFSFDGTNNSKINLGDYDIPTQRTVEVWFKSSTTNQLDNYLGLVAKDASGNLGSLFLGGNQTNDIIRWGAQGPGEVSYSATADLEDPSQYFHYVGTYDASGTDALKLYRNSVLVATKDSTNNPVTNDNNLYIGARVNGSAGFVGDIPIVRIYNRALTAAEVKQNYESQKGRFL